MDNYELFIVVFAPFVVMASTIILYIHNHPALKKLFPNSFVRISALSLCTLFSSVTAGLLLNIDDEFWIQTTASLIAVVCFMIMAAVAVDRQYTPSPMARLWISLVVFTFLVLIIPFVWMSGVFVTIAYVVGLAFLLWHKRKFPLMLQMMIAFLVMMLCIVVYSYVNACMGYMVQA